MVVRKLSCDYVDQLAKSRDPQCPPPYVENDIEATREHVKSQFAKFLSKARV